VICIPGLRMPKNSSMTGAFRARATVPISCVLSTLSTVSSSAATPPRTAVLASGIRNIAARAGHASTLWPRGYSLPER
jgi:hypothetical protein